MAKSDESNILSGDTVRRKLKEKTERNLNVSIDADTLADLLETSKKEAAGYIKDRELAQAMTDLDQIAKINSLASKIEKINAGISELEADLEKKTKELEALEKAEARRNKLVGYIVTACAVFAFIWPNVKPFFSASTNALFEKKVCQVVKTCDSGKATKPIKRK